MTDKCMDCGLPGARHLQADCIAALKLELEHANARELDRSRTFSAFLDSMWGLVYPEAPEGWEYPGMVFRHVRDYIQEHKTKIIDLQTKVSTLQDQVIQLQDIAEAVGAMFMEELSMVIVPEGARGRLFVAFMAYSSKEGQTNDQP